MRERGTSHGEPQCRDAAAQQLQPFARSRPLITCSAAAMTLRPRVHSSWAMRCACSSTRGRGGKSSACGDLIARMHTQQQAAQGPATGSRSRPHLDGVEALVVQQRLAIRHAGWVLCRGCASGGSSWLSTCTTQHDEDTGSAGMHVPGAALKPYPSCGAPHKHPRPRTRSRTAHRSASAASLISDWPLQAGPETAHPAQ